MFFDTGTFKYYGQNNIYYCAIMKITEKFTHGKRSEIRKPHFKYFDKKAVDCRNHCVTTFNRKL